MPLTKKEILIVVICCGVNFNFFFCDSMMAPFYPGEAETRGLSTVRLLSSLRHSQFSTQFSVGCVFGVAPAATVSHEPLARWLSLAPFFNEILVLFYSSPSPILSATS